MTLSKIGTQKACKDDSICHFARALRQFLGLEDRDGLDCCESWAYEHEEAAREAFDIEARVNTLSRNPKQGVYASPKG